MQRILTVCLGNICRSPMAEGMLRHVFSSREGLAHIEVDSAGTGSWHVGKPPDLRAQAAMAELGIDISQQRARQITSADFDSFDIITTMDMDNLANVRRMAPASSTARIVPFLDFAPDTGHRDVPDPWYGGSEGFELALDLIRAAAHGLADQIESESG